MICPNCNAENPPGAHYCHACGSRLDDALRCPSCGHVTPRKNYCAFCGANLQNLSQANAAHAPNPAQNIAVNPAQNPAANSAPSPTQNTTPAAAGAANPRHIFPIIETALLIGAALCLILTFFAGIRSKGSLSGTEIYAGGTVATGFPYAFREEFTLLYFFGGAFQDVSAHLSSLEAYSSLYAALLYTSAGIGAAIALFTLLSGLFGTVFAAKTYLDSHYFRIPGKNSAKYSLFALSSCLVGMMLLSFSFSVRVWTSAPGFDITNFSTDLNPAGKTVAILSLLLIFTHFSFSLAKNKAALFAQGTAKKTVCRIFSAGMLALSLLLFISPLPEFYYSIAKIYETPALPRAYDVNAPPLLLLHFGVFVDGDATASGNITLALLSQALGMTLIPFIVFSLKATLLRLANPENMTEAEPFNTEIFATGTSAENASVFGASAADASVPKTPAKDDSITKSSTAHSSDPAHAASKRRPGRIREIVFGAISALCGIGFAVTSIWSVKKSATLFAAHLDRVFHATRTYASTTAFINLFIVLLAGLLIVRFAFVLAANTEDKTK